MCLNIEQGVYACVCVGVGGWGVAQAQCINYEPARNISKTFQVSQSWTRMKESWRSVYYYDFTRGKISSDYHTFKCSYKQGSKIKLF